MEKSCVHLESHIRTFVSMFYPEAKSRPAVGRIQRCAQ